MLAERLAAEPTTRVSVDRLDLVEAERRVREAFDPIDPTGRISDECWSDYRRKWSAVASLVPRIDAVLEGWSDHAPTLQSLVRPSTRIAAGLSAAGTPVRLVDVGADVDSLVARWAVANCGLMRNRFTVVDLLTLLGWWLPVDVDELEARVAAAIVEGGDQP